MAKYYMEETELTKAITLIGHMERKIASACDNINQAYYKICTQSGLGVKEAKNALIQHGHTIDDQVENMAQIKAALSYIIEQTTAAEEAAKNELVSGELDANLEEPEILEAAAVTGSIISAATGTGTAQTTYEIEFISAYSKDRDSSIWPDGYSGTAGCGVASTAMALQSIGVQMTPKQIMENNVKVTGDIEMMAWGNQEVSLGINQSKLQPDDGVNLLEEALNNYLTGGGKYAAPIVYMYASPIGPHYVVVVGKNADGSYNIMDPSGYGITKLVIDASNVMNSGTKTFCCQIKQVVQYTK